MKTLIIFSNPEEHLQFAVIDGDYSNLDNVTIGSTDERSDEAQELIYNMNGGFRLPFTADTSILLKPTYGRVAVIYEEP